MIPRVQYIHYELLMICSSNLLHKNYNAANFPTTQLLYLCSGETIQELGDLKSSDVFNTSKSRPCKCMYEIWSNKQNEYLANYLVEVYIFGNFGFYQQPIIFCQNLPITNYQSDIDFTLICHAVLEH